MSCDIITTPTGSSMLSFDCTLVRKRGFTLDSVPKRRTSEPARYGKKVKKVRSLSISDHEEEPDLEKRKSRHIDDLTGEVQSPWA